ncbi:putative bacteriocin export ABC transporter [uncultured Trichococcus sp.]|uniref:putative bacteriocin export ABC transporter n=1 Tax=uncultured Trichococcus sp. TaxID=189665 RepID=UPI002A188BBB|nr:putative bacteriocin export ABC transporter [uncultured Trichococcus sp.]
MIKIDHLKKRIGERVLFDDLNVSIQKGEMVAITGKSGSGKTTLLNILGLLDREFQGHVALYHENEALNLKNTDNIRRLYLGYLFQNFALIDDESVEDNLKLALKYTQLSSKEKTIAIEQSLMDVGLLNLGKRKVYELSGGEQQRVAVARLILKPSTIILADEPTGSLDRENRDSILNLLKKLQLQGKTVIIVTHDVDVADFCDRKINISSI